MQHEGWPLVGRRTVSNDLTSFVAGSMLAGYRLEQELGRGGMAVVFRAVDERLDRTVALKILAPRLAADETFRQRFIRESHAAAAVDDPHIIPVFEAGEASGVLFIAMRYVPAGDVWTLIHREGPMSPARAGAIISPVASALDTAHAAGLVHRDVKSANMLLDVRPDRPDHVYLSDFGISKRELPLPGLTGTGQMIGTPGYCAPEQIEGRAVDGRADQYALACSAFELLTGAPPFQQDQPMAMMIAHISQPPPPLTARRPDLPPAADQVFARALAKAPADRYCSCREFADAVRQALGLAPYHSSPRPDQADGTPRADQADATPKTPRPDAGRDRTGDTPPIAHEIPTRRQEKPLRPQPGPGIKPRWTRNWTNWAIIAAVVLLVSEFPVASPKPNSIVLALGWASFSLLIVGLVAKSVRWIRRRRRERRIPPPTG
jgi:serine/threonine-protein kinase